MFSTLLVFCTAPSSGHGEAGNPDLSGPDALKIGCQRLLILLFGAPVDEVAGVEGDAEQIGGDETELGGADTDDADDGAIDGGDDPALPELFANKDGGSHGQDAREIIEANHLQGIEHVGQHLGRSTVAGSLRNNPIACGSAALFLKNDECTSPGMKNPSRVLERGSHRRV